MRSEAETFAHSAPTMIQTLCQAALIEDRVAACESGSTNGRTLREAAALLETGLRVLNSPSIHAFTEAVNIEAAHQRARWGAAHDAGKQPEDWFWLLGYLSGKALAAAKAGDIEKAMHHTISSAAMLANWHAAMAGVETGMRPGIDPEQRGAA